MRFFTGPALAREGPLARLQPLRDAKRGNDAEAKASQQRARDYYQKEFERGNAEFRKLL